MGCEAQGGSGVELRASPGGLVVASSTLLVGSLGLWDPVSVSFVPIGIYIIGTGRR
jgi:hypothetical protein